MEGSISTPQGTRPNLDRSHSGTRASTRADKMDMSKASISAAQSALAAHRATKYKDKFLAMKEKYEHVTSTHAQYERELAIASEKMRNLQNECNLLLDAVDIAVPGQPTLMHYLQHDPVPVHYATSNAPVVPEIPVVPVLIPIHHPPPPPQQQPVPVQPPPPQQVNGNNGHL